MKSCFLCGKTKNVETFSSDLLAECISTLIFRKDNGFKYGDIQLSKDSVEEVGYHVECKEKISLKALCEEEINVMKSRARLLTSVSKSEEIKSCYICGNQLSADCVKGRHLECYERMILKPLYEGGLDMMARAELRTSVSESEKKETSRCADDNSSVRGAPLSTPGTSRQVETIPSVPSTDEAELRTSTAKSKGKMSCFLCGKTENVLTFSSDLLARCISLLNFRRNRGYEYADIQLSTDSVEDVGYHWECKEKICLNDELSALEPIKTPFASTSEKSELGRFFREWQSAPQLQTFDDLPSSLEGLDLEKQLETYESDLDQYDNIVQSLCQSSSNDE